MANTKPLASQVRYGRGNSTSVDAVLKKSIISYNTKPEAVAAATTFPDGQIIQADGIEYVINSGKLQYKTIRPKSKPIPVLGSAVVARSDVSANNDIPFAGIKLIPKSGTPWDNWIFQGFCYVPQVAAWYTIWDRAGAIGVMKHGRDGVTTICSADASEHLGHGQTLGYFFDANGQLWLYTSSRVYDGTGMCLFKPPVSDGGSITDARHFKLFPDSYVVGSPGPCADSTHCVFVGWDNNTPADPYHAVIFDLKELLSGSDGDRSKEYLSDTRISPRDYFSGASGNVMQGYAATSDSIYILTGDDSTTGNKLISRIDIATSDLIWRSTLTAGKAFAESKGGVYEPEGLAWVPNAAGSLKLWVGLRARKTGGSGNDMFVAPLNPSDFGTGVNGATQIANYSARTTYDVVINDGEYYGFYRYSGPDSAPILMGRIGGANGRALFEENLYVGPGINTIFPSNPSTPTGVNLFGFGQLVAHRQDNAAQTLRRSGTSGPITYFFHDTVPVGHIDVRPEGTRYYLTNTVWIGSGAGSPEGVHAAPVGSMWTRTDASGANDVLYVKASGAGSTGWVAK